MNYTKKYHLPQWEESDRVMRTDFNQMCVDIENNLAAVQSEAKTAKTTAEAALAHKNYTAGVYQGSKESQIIELGFRPRAILIHCFHSGSKPSSISELCSLHLDTWVHASLTFTDTGFILPADSMKGYPNVNWENYHYIYIAFR